MSADQKILEIVQRNGPILPVEVASKAGLDSFLANAYLTQLVENGKIKFSKEKVGGSMLYFTPGNEAKATRRADELNSAKKSTANYQTAPVDRSNPELNQKREQFANRLKDIEKREQQQKTDVSQPQKLSVKEDFLERVKKSIAPIFEEEKQKTEPAEQSKPKVEHPKPKFIQQEQPKPKVQQQIQQPAKQPKIEPKKPEIKLDPDKTPRELAQEADIQAPEPAAEKQAPPKEEKKEEPKTTIKEKLLGKGKGEQIINKARDFLVDNQIEIEKSELIKRGKEAKMTVSMPTAIGDVKVYVYVSSKKRVNESDLSLAYTEGINQKMPVLFITQGQLTKTAQNYMKVIGNMLRVKSL